MKAEAVTRSVVDYFTVELSRQEASDLSTAIRSGRTGTSVTCRTLAAEIEKVSIAAGDVTDVPVFSPPGQDEDWAPVPGATYTISVSDQVLSQLRRGAERLGTAEDIRAAVAALSGAGQLRSGMFGTHKFTMTGQEMVLLRTAARRLSNIAGPQVWASLDNYVLSVDHPGPDDSPRNLLAAVSSAATDLGLSKKNTKLTLLAQRAYQLGQENCRSGH